MLLNTAKNLDILIKEKGYKQCAIAQKAGFSARELNDLINGRKTFKADYVLKICKALDITPNELFGISSSPEKD